MILFLLLKKLNIRNRTNISPKNIANPLKALLATLEAVMSGSVFKLGAIQPHFLHSSAELLISIPQSRHGVNAILIFLNLQLVRLSNLMISNVKVNTYPIKPSTTPASLNPSNRNCKTVSDDDSANPVSSSNFSK